MVRPLRVAYLGVVYHVMARGRGGHVFQGRYKSVPVSGGDADVDDFRIVAGCIHLNAAHRERHAEALVARHAPGLGLPTARRELESLSKGDERKPLLASWLVSKTIVSRVWLGQRLGMGHPGSVSRMLGVVRKSGKAAKTWNAAGYL